MAASVETIRSSIKIIAKVLSGKKINVTQEGMRAYVESVKGVPKRINIPNLPDNASEELILAINGFLDHEVAHILFTDFEEQDLFHKLYGEFYFSIYNVIEDSRIEVAMRQRFFGSKTNLNGVGEFLIEKQLQPNYVEAKKSGNFKDIVGVLFVPAVRAWAGQDVFAKFMEDKWADIEPLVETLKSAIPDVKKVKSTKDSTDLAIKIGKLMKNEDDDSSDDGDGESDSPERDDSTDAGPDDGGKGSSDKDGESKGEGDGEESSSESGSKGSKDSEDGESDSDKSKDSESGSDKSKDGLDEDEEGDTKAKPSGVAPTGLSESSRSAISEIAESMEIEDIQEAISKAISDESISLIKTAEYTVFSRDYDIVEPFDLKKSGRSDAVIESTLGEISEESRKISGALQKTLERLIKAKSKSRNIPGKRSGRVNASSLYRLSTGDDRVFRQKEVSATNDVAISLVVDLSGSMSGQKLRTAMEGAYSLCEVLTRVGVTCEVIGFTTADAATVRKMRDAAYREKQVLEERVEYSRHEPLYIPIFKSFDEKFGPLQKRRIASASMSGSFTTNNVDGESIRIAAKRLATMTKEPGKAMIILSDGSPSADGDYYAICKDLKDAIAEIEKMGIGMIGIGIRDRTVEQYYKNNVVINNVSELPELIMKELKEILL